MEDNIEIMMDWYWLLLMGYGWHINNWLNLFIDIEELFLIMIFY